MQMAQQDGTHEIQLWLKSPSLEAYAPVVVKILFARIPSHVSTFRSSYLLIFLNKIAVSVVVMKSSSTMPACFSHLSDLRIIMLWVKE